MANIKSAEKRARQTKVRTLRNRIVKTKVKNKRKAINILIASGKLDDREKSLNDLYTSADRAAKKGVLHKNTVARIKSRLTITLNKASKASGI